MSAVEKRPNASIYMNCSPQDGNAAKDCGYPLANVILSVANTCNLRCDYCVVFQSPDKSYKQKPPFMSYDVIAQTASRLSDHVKEYEIPQVSVTFHGAEATLAWKRDRSYFRNAVRLFQEELPDGTDIFFSVQSNGILFGKEPELLQELSECGVRAGISLDGGKKENWHRVYPNGRESFDDVKKGVDALSRYPDIYTGLLLVVDPTSDPESVYKSICALHPPNIDFNLPHNNWSDLPPHYDPKDDAKPYADWLVKVFKMWQEDILLGKNPPHIRMFEQILHGFRGEQIGVETYGLTPNQNIVVDTDGSLEVSQAFKSAYPGAASLGLNIFEHSLSKAMGHPVIQALQAGAQSRSEQCQSCPLVEICGGGLQAHRYAAEDDPEKGLTEGFSNPSVYCKDLGAMIGQIAVFEAGTINDQRKGIEIFTTALQALDQESRRYPIAVGMEIARRCQLLELDPQRMKDVVMRGQEHDTWIVEELSALGRIIAPGEARDITQEITGLFAQSCGWASEMCSFSSTDYRWMERQIKHQANLRKYELEEAVLTRADMRSGRYYTDQGTIVTFTGRNRPRNTPLVLT